MLLSRCSQSLKHHEGDRFECDPLWVVFFLFFFSPLSSPRQCQLYPDRYLSWAHTARCSGGNRVCAVLRIPSCLLPSDSSSLAGASAPSVQCSRYKWYCEEAARAVHPHMNGRVGEFPLWLARLLRAPVCSQASLVCCVSGGTDWSSGIVIWPLSERGVCLLINVFSGLLHRGRKCHKSSDFRAKAIDPLREH